MFIRKNRQVGLLVLATLLLVVQLSSQDPAQSRGKLSDRITGVVINSVTREPIARALVVSQDEQYATMTDGNGRFEFVINAGENAHAPGGERIDFAYRPNMLTARKPGYLGSHDEDASPGQRVIDGKEMEIALVPEALIIGHVFLPTSEPPDPIAVELFRREVRNGRAHWVSVKGQSTNSEGEFRFAELPAGNYKLLTHELREEDPKFSVPGGQAYGYAPVYYPNASGFASAGTIELRAGQTAEAKLTLTRQPYYAVNLPVTNVPSGTGIGLDVSVQGPGGPGYSLEYDSQKQAIVGLLPNGNYKVRATGMGEQLLSGEANITVRGRVEGTVLPVAAIPAVRVNVIDEFTTEVTPFTTTTVNRQGRQIQELRRFDVNVTLQPADDFTTQEQNASTVGHPETQPESAKFDVVTPGSYWVDIYPTTGYAASVTSGGVDLRQHPLVVPAGSSVPPVEVILRNDSASIEGVVDGVSSLTGPPTPVSLGPYGSGVSSSDSSARLYFIPLPDSPGHFTEQNVSQDGKFSVTLAPGDYRVLVFANAQPEFEYLNPAAMRAYDGKGQVVRLSAGQKEHVHLQLISPSE